jgi:hypothetical protein
MPSLTPTNLRHTIFRLEDYIEKEAPCPSAKNTLMWLQNAPQRGYILTKQGF